MKKIIFADVFYYSGVHSEVYAEPLLKGLTDFQLSLDDCFLEKFSRKAIIKSLLTLFRKKDVHIHFLFVDVVMGTIVLLYPLLLALKKANRLTVSCTYHNFNRNHHMNRIHKLFDGIIVHSGLMGNTANFEPVVIPHPSFLQPSESRRVNPDPVRFGFLGGNRPDKRYDLFVDAMNRLTFNLEVIAGGKDCDLEENGLSLNKESKITSRYLSNDEMREMIEYIDILVLPYEKSFSGVSGPLIEAAYASKVIVCSDAPLLKHLVEEHQLGEVFKSGDLEDLIEKINLAVFRYSEYNNCNFRNKFSKDMFVERHRQFFNSILATDRLLATDSKTAIS